MKKIKVCFALFLICVFMCANTFGVFAHEMYYEDEGTPVPILWGDVTGGVANLKMSGELLSGYHVSQYEFMKDAWPDASDNVLIIEVDFDESNVDLATATSEYWTIRWGAEAHATKGVCDLTTTDGIRLTDDLEIVKSSSRLIRYAGILLNPYTDDMSNTYIRRVMVHEIGHALGLGHPDGKYDYTLALSVMRRDQKSYYTPEEHDIVDLKNRY